VSNSLDADETPIYSIYSGSKLFAYAVFFIARRERPPTPLERGKNSAI